MIKWKSHQENITVVDIYVPNIEAPKYIKQLLTYEGRITQQPIMVNFITPLSTINRPFRMQKH